MAEEPQIPVRIISVPQPAAHEHEAAIDPISRPLARVRDRGPKFCLGLCRQHFIGIEDENPGVPERKIFQRPVFFLRPGAVEFKLDDPRAKLFRDAL